MAVKVQDPHYPFYAEVGRRIQQARKAQKMTQEALASRICLTRSSVTNIESGEQKFLLHTLMDIAAALKVQPVALLPDHYEAHGSEIDTILREAPAPVADWIKSAVRQDMRGPGKDANDGSSS